MACDALDADGADLDHPAVAHGADHGDQAAIDEIDVFDRRPRGVHQLAPVQLHGLEPPLQAMQAFLGQRLQQPVGGRAALSLIGFRHDRTRDWSEFNTPGA